MWGVRVSIRPEQPEPFLRGCVFPAVTDAPYPRHDPAGADYLPADVWDAAQLPVGVRLEMVGTARTIRVWYKTTRASLGYRGESAGCSFVAYRGGQKVAAADAVMGEGMAELALSGRPELPVTVYFPEGMQPIVTGVAGVEETMVPAPLQPRWLAYGDAVTQGWLASAPAMAWPAVAGRKLGLDVCNLGYAGTARGETTSALMMAETPAEVVSIAFGLNNWSRVPHTTGLMSEEVRCFLSVVRAGHPEIPIVVVSPTARPDAEDSPNRVGATLAELRLAMEEAVLDLSADDEMLFLVHGRSVVDPEDLEDGIYPGDEGHRRLAAAVSKILVPHLADLQLAAEKRWASKGTSPTSDFAPPVAVAVPPDADPPNFDLPEIESLDRTAFDDALLDVLSPDGPSAHGVSANGVSANGASADGASVGAEPVDTEPVDTETVGTERVGTEPNDVSVEGSSSTDGATGPGEPTTEVTKHAGRGTEPVDVDVADMVAAALALAANGADGTATFAGAGELQWGDPGPTGELQWEDPGATGELQWEDPGATGELQGGAPGPTGELQWGDPGPTGELQWGDPGPTGERQWEDPGAADELPWGDPGGAEELQWVDPGQADELQWVDPGQADELQWSVVAEPGQS